MIHWIFFLVGLLRLPFISQASYDPWHTNDCGPASAAMIVSYYGGGDSGNFYDDMEIANDLPQPMYTLGQWLMQKEFDVTLRTNWTMQGLRETVMERRVPVLVLIEEDFGGHYVVVVGIKDDTVYVHDPIAGPYQSIPRELFEDKWNYPSSWANNQAIIAEGISDD